MDTNNNINNERRLKIIKNTFIIIFSVFVGFVSNFFLDKYLPEKISNYKKGHSKGFDYTKQVALELDNSFRENVLSKKKEPISTGSILSINEKQILIKYVDPEGRQLNLIFNISLETKIMKQVLKSKELLDKNLDMAFNNRNAGRIVATNTELLPYYEISISINDLKVGDYINFKSESELGKDLLFIKKILVVQKIMNQQSIQ